MLLIASDIIDEGDDDDNDEGDDHNDEGDDHNDEGIVCLDIIDEEDNESDDDNITPTMTTSRMTPSPTTTIAMCASDECECWQQG